MRLFELQNPTEKSEFNLNPQEMKFILDLVKDETMSQSELRDRINDATVDYTRNKNSLRNGAVRMYTIVHGELPLDMTDTAGWFNIPSTMVKYAESQGYDVAKNIQHAKIDAKNRTAKIKPEEAKNIMLSYWRDHQDYLDKNAVTRNRPVIQKKIENGEHIEVAFAPYRINESYWSAREKL